MSEIQAVTVVASILGFVATVLNLVAFVREKDKSHTRAGFLVLSLIVAALAVFFFPRYAPQSALRILNALPESAARPLQGWLGPVAPATPQPPPPSEAPTPLRGSCSIEIQRNLLGGIGAVVANFQFANLSSQELRVTVFHISITEKRGEAAHVYDRVLPQPLVIAAHANLKSQFEFDEEIRDRWVPWRDVEASARGPLEVRWEGQDAQGHSFSAISRNG